MSEQWYPIKGAEKGEDFFIDLSHLLDAPAGKHGFVRSREEFWEFSDGTPARFLGLALGPESIFLPIEQIRGYTDRIAKMGCNAVRLHHMEAPWPKMNIFDKNEKTRTLGKEAMHRLDFLVAELKKRGIYIYIDFLVSREFSRADGVDMDLEFGAKQVAMIHPDVIALQKEFISQIMNHVNEFSGIAYKDDPVFIGGEFVNETSTFCHWKEDVLQGSAAELAQRLWEQKYPEEGKRPLFTTQKSKLGQYSSTLKCSAEGEKQKKAYKFYTELEIAYGDTMRKHCREVGVKFPISSTNFPFSWLNTLKAKAREDHIITNTYLSHPWYPGKNPPFQNVSPVETLDRTIPAEMCRYVIKNKPLVITEWNVVYPNTFRAEALPLVVASSLFHNWPASFQFAFHGRRIGAEPLSFFDVSTDPLYNAAFSVMAVAYHHNLIREADERFDHAIDPALLDRDPNQDDFLTEYPWLPFAVKFCNNFDGVDSGENTRDSIEKKYHKKGRSVTSCTGELTFDYAEKRFIIDAEGIQAIFGKLNGEKVATKQIELAVANQNSTVVLVSLDGQSLEHTSEALLYCASRIKPTGQKFTDDPELNNESNFQCEEEGRLPLLAEKVAGTLTFQNRTISSVVGLECDGSPGSCIPEFQGNTLNLQSGKNLLYKISFGN